MNKLNYANRHIMLDYLTQRVERDEQHRPLAICIVDDAGRLLEAVLMDGAPKRMLEFGYYKAYTAAKMGKSTAHLRDHLSTHDTRIGDFCDPKMTVLRGGAPIVDMQGEIIGAIGMSGWKSEEDQELASSAVEQLRDI